MFVVCTVKVTDPLLMSSPALIRTDVVPALPELVFVYCTYNVSGSEPVAATTCNILTMTPEV